MYVRLGARLLCLRVLMQTVEVEVEDGRELYCVKIVELEMV